MATVAGVDSSTQSCKVVVCDADTGEVLARGHAPHPDGTEVPPEAWWTALQQAGKGLLDNVDAVSIAGQQHGLVALDRSHQPVRDALLWNDVRSAEAADDLVAELGGPQAWLDAVGSVPVAAFTAAKLRWMADHEPDLADRVTRVMLPHDYLTWRLRGGGDAEPATDRSDASGTGYWSAAQGRYREDLLAIAFRGRRPELPTVLAPFESAGRTTSGALVAAGAGDNAAAALGLGIGDGDVVISLGTSGTAFARTSQLHTDPFVNGFADATGQFLPLVCTLNAARVLESMANALGIGIDQLDALARQAPPGADGLVLLPYLSGERTPNLPHATGSLHGLRAETMRPAHLARAAVEGMLCNMADALDRLRAAGATPQRVLLIGGGSRSALVIEIAAQIFDVSVTVTEPEEYVAVGAALQAAWALHGGSEPPQWPAAVTVEFPEPDDSAVGLQIRSAYGRARKALYSK
ncbi:xylulose kinase XylB [Nocardia nova SH22a]|uniref:Xylulose kinase n=1 Tax=Nocardia nova SH22a TaxID=1415166 RepID=W5TBN9_9NOCA|nr:xylulokinase [Nocardia nova]AHH16642.1 xylulose kinase XylB [Nocardia nova SH22a]